MRKKFIAATVSVAALIALSTAVSATAGGSSTVTLEEMLPVLAAPQTDSDRAPDEIDLASLGGVLEDSLRWAGSSETGNYWVGRAGTSNVCLVLQLAADPLTSASACAPITEFYRIGLKLRVEMGDPSAAAEAYILPADIDVIAIGASQATATADVAVEGVNLVSGRPNELKGLKPSEVPRDNGMTFQFYPLS